MVHIKSIVKSFIVYIWGHFVKFSIWTKLVRAGRFPDSQQECWFKAPNKSQTCLEQKHLSQLRHIRIVLNFNYFLMFFYYSGGCPTTAPSWWNSPHIFQKAHNPPRRRREHLGVPLRHRGRSLPPYNLVSQWSQGARHIEIPGM